MSIHAWIWGRWSGVVDERYISGFVRPSELNGEFNHKPTHRNAGGWIFGGNSGGILVGILLGGAPAPPGSPGGNNNRWLSRTGGGCCLPQTSPSPVTRPIYRPFHGYKIYFICIESLEYVWDRLYNILLEIKYLPFHVKFAFTEAVHHCRSRILLNLWDLAKLLINRLYT